MKCNRNFDGMKTERRRYVLRNSNMTVKKRTENREIRTEREIKTVANERLSVEEK